MLRAAWETLNAIVRDFLANKPFQLAAALSYFTLLSMVPLFLLVTGAAGLVFGDEVAREQLLSHVGELMGRQQVDVIRALLAQAGNHHSSVVSTVIGTIVLLIGATTVFAHLQATLNQIWGVDAVSARSVLWRLVGSRLLALAVVLGMIFVLLVSTAISVALDSAGDYLAHLFPGAAVILRVVYALFSFAVVIGVIALLYKYVPDAEIQWRDVLVGALITGVLFAAGKFGLGVYLAHLRYRSAGAAGALILIVIWVYYSALILLLGAQATQVYACRFGKPIRPKPHARLHRRA